MNLHQLLSAARSSSLCLMMITVWVLLISTSAPTEAFQSNNYHVNINTASRRHQKHQHHQNIISTHQQYQQKMASMSRNCITPLYSSALSMNEDGEEEEGGETSGNTNTNALDKALSRLTNAFPLFVLSSAILGMTYPSSLQWVNRGNSIELMLALVMTGTGMTLEKKDFTSILEGDNWTAVPLGVLCQFGIMPLAAFLVGRAFLLPLDPSLFLGLVLVGCSPGGTASNLVTLIAGANVALSVLLTTCSTLLASIVTPLLVKLLVGGTISVSGKALCVATSKVVLLPVLLGMFFHAKLPRLSRYLSRFTPFASVLLVAAICGGVVAKNAMTILGKTAAAATSSLLPILLFSVVSLHSIGFGLGYWVPSSLLTLFPQSFAKNDDNNNKNRKRKKATSIISRTVSIETGMQNSALAVVLAQSIGAPPLAALPGALSATAHSCLGSILAAYWRMEDEKQEKKESSSSSTTSK